MFKKVHQMDIEKYLHIWQRINLFFKLHTKVVFVVDSD